MSQLPPIELRPVRAHDVPALLAGCMADEPPGRVEALVRSAQRIALARRGVGVVAVRQGELIGFGQLTLWPSTAEISDLAVAPAWRGRGVGTAIITHLSRAAYDMHADRLEIGAAAANERALALYHRLGFVPERRVELDLGDGAEPVIYLSKVLRPAKP